MMDDSIDTYDFFIKKGSTFQSLLTWYEEDFVTPINLTGYTARMYLTRGNCSEKIVFNLTTENGRITLTPLTGEILLNISATDTGSMNGEYSYFLELISGAYVNRILRGQVTIDPECEKCQ